MNKTIAVVTLILFVFVGFSCARRSASSLERFYRGDAEEVDKSMIFSLGMAEIVANTDEYLGSFIETEGKIVSLCSVGCFFFIQDEDDHRLYVTLSPKNFDVPQTAYGHRVRVMGLLERRGTTTSIIAYEVEFLDVKK